MYLIIYLLYVVLIISIMNLCLILLYKIRKRHAKFLIFFIFLIFRNSVKTSVWLARKYRSASRSNQLACRFQFAQFQKANFQTKTDWFFAKSRRNGCPLANVGSKDKLEPCLCHPEPICENSSPNVLSIITGLLTRETDTEQGPLDLRYQRPSGTVAWISIRTAAPNAHSQS
jgi:hypothetical protein